MTVAFSMGGCNRRAMLWKRISTRNGLFQLNPAENQICMPEPCRSAVGLRLAHCHTVEWSSPALQGKQIASPNSMGSYQQLPKYSTAGIYFNYSSSADDIIHESVFTRCVVLQFFEDLLFF